MYCRARKENKVCRVHQVDLEIEVYLDLTERQDRWVLRENAASPAQMVRLVSKDARARKATADMMVGLEYQVL